MNGKHSLFAELKRRNVLRGFAQLDPKICIPIQGPDEQGGSGKLQHRDRTNALPEITVPTMTVGAAHGIMDPEHMQAPISGAEPWPNRFLP